eukprot:2308082-Karenia_brevis.AAC.1
MPKRDVSPSVISFSAAISACVKGGQWQRVAPLLDEMCTPGLPHDVISFSAAMLDEMPNRGVPPAEISFNAAIAT